MASPMPGTLFVVATPIGNLEDFTYRANRVLREVDVIAAEDTRRTAKLLAHYRIERPLTSYREHNESRETPKLLARLEAGTSIALVTDAGTPSIADPGARLVRAALDRGLLVVPIPGPSAVAAGLSVSGVEASEFVFMGFPPASGAARSAWMERLAGEHRPVVLFEAPHRINRTWSDLGLVSPNRRIIACRELTKINEELVTGPIMVTAVPREKGEFVLILAPPDQETTSDESEITGDLLDLGVRVEQALTAAGFGRRESLEMASLAVKQDPKAFGRAIKKHKILVKQHRNDHA